MIDRELIVKDFRDKGMTIPQSYLDSNFDDYLKREFNGDRAEFLKFVQSQGKTIKQFKQEQEKDLIVGYMQNNKRQAVAEISPRKIKDYYEANKAKWYTPASAKISLITLKTGRTATLDENRKLAKEIVAKFNAGEKFSELARKYSKDDSSAKGGEWGWYKKGELNPLLDKQAFAIEAGKITALEVGGAYSVDDCWQLVRAYEKTKTPFFFMENCCYGKNELLATGMARKGLLGEISYCHGAYCHDLREEISYGVKNRHYRLRNYLSRNCDNYPTHELGPIAKLLNVNRGNRMLSLVSLSSKAAGLGEYVKKHDDLSDLHGKSFMQGDVVQTLITCADGTLISLKLDTTLPHAYSREFTVNGSRGMYTENGNVALLDGGFDHEKNMSDYYGTAKEYEKECLPKIWRDLTEEQIKAGHGGMDFLMMREFISAVKNGSEMPIDVYDAASWMAITCLSEDSIANGGAPVAIPDFTNGQWVMREKKDVTEF